VPVVVDRSSVSRVARPSKITLLMPFIHNSPPIKTAIARNYTA
jgi:hypothetical protein